MKKIFYLLFIFSFFACNTSQSLLKRGEYDAAVRQAVSKLQRNPNREKDKQTLKKAYPLAVKQDLDRINYLNIEGQPDRWEEIYLIYKKLKERQDLAETVTPFDLNGKQVKFEHKDYTSPMIEAKRKAALYFYTHAKKLMQGKNKFSYRKAYEEFQKAKKYNPSYYDIDSLSDICYNLGQTYVILIVQNSTMYKLTDDFLINLIDFPVAQLNSFWIKYFNTDQRNGDYDINIYIVLKVADVSPDRLEAKTDVVRKKIQDGYEYKTDANGNLVKDSLGNPIKVPKYKTISCEFKKYRQFKIAHIEGFIDYVDNSSNQSVLRLPIAADHVFESFYYVGNGDLNALSDRQRNLIRDTRPVPYPHPLGMIYAANETLKQVIFDALMQNKSFLETNY